MILKRFMTGDTGTFGKWLDDDGASLCFTVERPKTGDHPCIEPGTYTFNQYDSPKHGDVWLREDCGDGRTMIEIHPANWASQLLGCIAPGLDVEVIEGTLGVSASQDTFKMLKSRLGSSFILIIKEEFNAI